MLPDEFPYQQIVTEVTLENNQDIVVTQCDEDCVDNYTLPNLENVSTEEKSLYVETGNLTVESLKSLDGNIQWIKFFDTENPDSLHIHIQQIKLVKVGNGNRSQLNHEHTYFSSKANSFGASLSLDVLSPPLYSQIRLGFGVPSTWGYASNCMKNFAKKINPIPILKKLVNSMAEAAERARIQNLQNLVEHNYRPIEGEGRILDCFASTSKSICPPTRPGGSVARGASGVARSALRSSRALRVAAGAARIGLRFASRFALPLMVLDIGLTAYEFCSENPQTCHDAWDRIAGLFQGRPSNQATASSDTTTEQSATTEGDGICRVPLGFWQFHRRKIATVTLEESYCIVQGRVAIGNTRVEGAGSDGFADGTEFCGVCERTGNNTFGQPPNLVRCSQPEDPARTNPVPFCPSNWSTGGEYEPSAEDVIDNIIEEEVLPRLPIPDIF